MMTNKMVQGQRYRQNSTGSEVLCVGHDQGGCVVRFIDGRGRDNQERYQLMWGIVGTKGFHWTEVGMVKRIGRKVSLSVRDNLILELDDGQSNDNVVTFTFEDDKLINVTMLNN